MRMETSAKRNENLVSWFQFFEKLKIGQVPDEIIKGYKIEPPLFLDDKVCYQVYSFSTSSNIFLSKSIEKITGYTVEEGLAGMPFLQKTMPPEDGPKVLAICQAVFGTYLMSLSAQQVAGLKFRAHTRLQRKDGKIIWIRHEGCYFGLDENDRPSFFAGFLLDVTDQVSNYTTSIDNLFAFFLEFSNGRTLRIGLDSTGGMQTCYFTKRELEIIQYAYQGLSSKLIASELNISINTVNNHKSNIMNRLGASNMIETIAIAKEKGFL